MPEDISTGLGKSLDYFWDGQEGYAYIATLDAGKHFKQYMIAWPEKRSGIIRHILAQNAEGKDVYISPPLYSARRPIKENVKGTNVLWTDFDGNAPDDWATFAKEKGIPEPSYVINSSVKGHEHAYWRLDNFETSIEAIEDRNRALAYRLGADTTGWDADQLLRPPFTTNYGYKGTKDDEPAIRKPWFDGYSVPVTIGRKNDKASVSINSFEALGTPEREYLDRLELSAIPSVAEVLAYGRWDEEFLSAFGKSKDQVQADGDRSGAIMRLGYLAVEHGFTDEQVYAVLDDADKRWQKYTSRSKSGREKLLHDIIARARAKRGSPTEGDLTFAGLLGNASEGVIESEAKLVYSFQEFLDTTINIEWLVDDLIAHEGIGIVTGYPGVGKTQFGIQLAATMALGKEDFLTWENKSGPKKVLFLSLEMSHAPLKKFVDAIAGAYSDKLTLSRNFHIAPIGSPIPLDIPEGQAFLDNLLAEYKPDVLFIDSLQKVTSKELSDELSAKALLNYMQALRKKHKCAIYLVHHNRKKSNETTQSPGTLSDMYGSQFIAADMDFVINMRKLGDSRVIAIDCWKQRLAQEFRSFEVERTEFLQFIKYTGGIEDVSRATIIRPGNGDGEGPQGTFLSL